MNKTQGGGSTLTPRSRVARRTLALVGALVAGVGVSVAVAQPAQAAGWCYPGIAYGDAGTDHNYVMFQVNASAPEWHIEREWWAFFPADLWANPNPQYAYAGIQGTDWNPPYPPSGYKLCTGPA